VADPGDDLLLAVETLNRFESYFLHTAADALRFVEDVEMPNVKVHLDTFHMLQEEDDLGAAIRACGDRLGYFHACGSQRGVPGRGGCCAKRRGGQRHGQQARRMEDHITDRFNETLCRLIGQFGEPVV
jgi:hypothetical protein